MRTALKAAFSALDAREKACHPPTGAKQFTEDPRIARLPQDGAAPVEIQNCQLISLSTDSELVALQQRAAALPSEIQSTEDSINNIKKRMSSLQRDLREVGTYIPPESTRT